MNILILLIMLIGMVVTGAVCCGLICLQVYISKNNKKGKFAIPIILMLLPFCIIILSLIFKNGNSVITFIGPSALVITYCSAIINFPCVLITLIIEIIYRYKRKGSIDNNLEKNVVK